MGMFSRIDFGSVRLDATFGNWARTVSDVEISPIEFTSFRAGAPWYGGEFEIMAPLAGARRFAFFVDSVLTGSPTSTTGAEFDEIDELNELFNPLSASEIELKTQRADSSNSTISRSIWVRCVQAYPYNIVPDIGGTGVVAKRGTGRIRYRVECEARFPFWRDTTATTANLTATTGTPTVAITNNGLPCGVRVDCGTETGTVNSLAISNSANSYAVTFTSPDSGDYLDAAYTDPTEVAFSGTPNAAAWLRLDNGTNTMTGTCTGGTSIALTFTYRQHWASP